MWICHFLVYVLPEQAQDLSFSCFANFYFMFLEGMLLDAYTFRIVAASW